MWSATIGPLWIIKKIRKRREGRKETRSCPSQTAKRAGSGKLQREARVGVGTVKKGNHLSYVLELNSPDAKGSHTMEKGGSCS